MSLFNPSQIELIRKYFPLENESDRCTNCIYKEKETSPFIRAAFNDTRCDKDCPKPWCNLCFMSTTCTRDRIAFDILDHIIRLPDYVHPFMEFSNIFGFVFDRSLLKKHKNSTRHKNDASYKTISKLLINMLYCKKYDRADFLISLGADINYNFRPKYTLPVFLKFDARALKYIFDNGYDFTIQSNRNRNALDNAVSDYIAYPSYAISKVEEILKYIPWDLFHIQNIGEFTYGDRAQDEFDEDYRWRQCRINKLLEMGMQYDLEEIVSPKWQKKLKNTRLGYYLIWRSIIKNKNV